MKKLLFISIFIAFAALINAQTITPGMSGLQLRNAVNAKTSALSDSLLTAFDSITAQRGRIALGLLKSDTAAMLDNYTRNGELLSRLNNYLLKSDTTSMLDNYARNGEVISRLGNYLLKSDTASMLDNYTRNSELNTGLAAKQNTLVSGTNIKTINSQSLLGSGNITISGGGGGDMVYPGGSGLVTVDNGAWGTTVTNNSGNWNTAYSERLRWDGGSTGLNAATGRTSLGATTVGSNLFTLANPSAIRYIRTNADNTISLRTTTELKSDIALNNVTNESKATMFTNPTFTGTVTMPSTTSIGNVSSTEIGYVDGVTSSIQTQINGREPALGNPSTDGYVLSSTASGTRSWIAPASGGSMVYPGAGIPTSTGSAWGSSITNNSANWNTAYNWGNHANAGYFVGTNSTIRGLFSSSATGLSYNNSTGAFSLTSGYGIPTTTSITNWNTAYGWGNHASAGYRTAAQVGTQIHDTIAGGVALSSVAVMIADTANMLAHYLRKCDAGSGGLTSAQVATQIGDTISARLAAAVPGLRLRDSTGNATGNYMTRAGTTTMVNTREAALGNPSTNGYILSSTTAGVRSWIAPPSGGSMVYPSGSGIPIVNNGAWGTTITDNSANWNTAYGWGNHASAGYRNASQVGGQIRDSLIVAKNEDSNVGPLFVFGTGSGHIADTALFNNGRIAGSFYNSGQDTLYVTEVRGVLVEGAGTETITVNISWDVNMMDATPTNMFGTGFTVTSMTTGSVSTSFSNNMILPGQWVWCTLSGASPNNKPTMLILTMTGYKRNRSN